MNDSPARYTTRSGREGTPTFLSKRAARSGRYRPPVASWLAPGKSGGSSEEAGRAAGRIPATSALRSSAQLRAWRTSARFNGGRCVLKAKKYVDSNVSLFKSGEGFPTKASGLSTKVK